MNSFRKLWWVGAVAIIAACDPYDDENTGAPDVLSVFASNADEAFEGTGDLENGFSVVAPSTCTPVDPEDPTSEEETVADAPVVYVKFNKLLDGASIQETPASCAPKNEWLTVVTTSTAADPAVEWFSCYNPSSPTSSEGASVIIYPGADVTGGAEGEGWFTGGLPASKSEAIVYTLTGTVADKQGNQIPLDITFTINPDAGPVDVTVAAGVLTWDAAGCGTATGYNVYKLDATDDAPVLLTPAPITATTYTDASFVAGREYLVAPVIGSIETKPQGPFAEPTP
jgi:hypothetical protein